MTKEYLMKYTAGRERHIALAKHLLEGMRLRIGATDEEMFDSMRTSEQRILVAVLHMYLEFERQMRDVLSVVTDSAVKENMADDSFRGYLFGLGISYCFVLTCDPFLPHPAETQMLKTISALVPVDFPHLAATARISVVPRIVRVVAGFSEDEHDYEEEEADEEVPPALMALERPGVEPGEIIYFWAYDLAKFRDALSSARSIPPIDLTFAQSLSYMFPAVFAYSLKRANEMDESQLAYYSSISTEKALEELEATRQPMAEKGGCLSTLLTISTAVITPFASALLYWLLNGK